MLRNSRICWRGHSLVYSIKKPAGLNRDRRISLLRDVDRLSKRGFAEGTRHATVPSHDSRKGHQRPRWSVPIRGSHGEA